MIKVELRGNSTQCASFVRSMTINMDYMDTKTPLPAQRLRSESAPTSPLPIRSMNMKTTCPTSTPCWEPTQSYNFSFLVIAIMTTATRQPLPRHLHPLLLAIQNSSLLRIIRQFHPHQLPLLGIQIIKLPCLLALRDIIMNSSSPMAGDLRSWKLDGLTVPESIFAVKLLC